MPNQLRGQDGQFLADFGSSRISLAEVASTRDSTRAKGSWQRNTYTESERTKKRPGFDLTSAGTTPGQGLFNYGGLTVSIQADVLHVGASTYAL